MNQVFKPISPSFPLSSSNFGYTNEYFGDYNELLYLRARYYAPGMGRFLTKDTWVGNSNSPISFNHWNYGYSNPINYTDPSGYYSQLVSFKIGQEYGTIENTVWLPDEKRLIEKAVWNIAVAYARGYNSYVLSKTPSVQCLVDTNGMPLEVAYLLLNSGGMGVQRIDPTSAFLRIHDGQVTFSKHDHKYKKTYTNEKGQVVTEELDNYGLGPNKNSVYLYPKGEYSVDKFGKGNATLSETNFIRFATHEMGHVFDHAIGDKGRGATTGTLAGGGSNSSPNGFCGLYSTYQEGWQWRASDEYYEYFADMFTGWIYGCWEADPLRSSGLSETGELRSNFMNENMPIWIYEKIKGR